jgi:hypothetical protein
MRILVIGAGASLLLLLSGVKPVLAGPCSDEISQLQQRLASSDAGSGPTMRTGSTDPVTATGSVQNPTASSGAGSASPGSAPPTVAATPRQAPRAGEVPETQATAAMNALTENRATSPQDVRAQIEGQPTSSQVAGGAAPQADHAKLAAAALERARLADQRGDASACSTALTEARSLIGSR